MNNLKCIIGMSLLLSSAITLASEFNLHRGDLQDIDKIDVEWRRQSGNCPTKFPIESTNCSYTYSNIKGIPATYIDQFSLHTDFSTENTFLLNISVNGRPLESCQKLQQKIFGYSRVIINENGCILN